MRPDYKERRDTAGEKRDRVIALRVTGSMFEKLEKFALAEDDTLSALVVEGIMRTIDNREQDPEYMAGLTAAGEARIAELQAEIVRTKQAFGLSEDLRPIQ